jgi:tetratricopeptide (TPR) repeat protein
MAALPDQPGISAALAQAELSLGNVPAAEQAALHASSSNPADRNAALLLAQALERQGRFDEAIQRYRNVWGENENYPSAGAYLARVLYRAGRTAEADAINLAALVDVSPDATALSFLGRALTSRGDGLNAEKAYLALVRTPDFIAAQSRVRRSRPHEGEEALEQAAIVQNFWKEYSEVLRDQDWFHRALAERDAPNDEIRPYRPEIWHSESRRAAGGPSITLVSFSSPAFRSTQEQLSRSALVAGEIDHAVLWTSEELKRTKFYRDHRSLLDRPRGSGYWVWKPFIILNELLAREDGACVLYHDSGRGAGYGFTRSIAGFVKHWATRPLGILPGTFLQKYGPTRLWTKRDCFHYMDCDSERYWNAPQVTASFSVWWNSAAARDFVRRWLAFAIDPRVVSDYPNVSGLANHPGFFDHRHDQSILSNLVERHRLDLPVCDLTDLTVAAEMIGASISRG